MARARSAGHADTAYDVNRPCSSMAQWSSHLRSVLPQRLCSRMDTQIPHPWTLHVGRTRSRARWAACLERCRGPYFCSWLPCRAHGQALAGVCIVCGAASSMPLVHHLADQHTSLSAGRRKLGGLLAGDDEESPRATMAPQQAHPCNIEATSPPPTLPSSSHHKAGERRV
jgi:hypothetical protein